MNSIFFIFFLTILCLCLFTIIGKSFYFITGKENKNIRYELYPIVGFSIFSIILSFLYLYFSLEMTNIRKIIYVISLFAIIRLFYFEKLFLKTSKNFLKIITYSVPILIFFLAMGLYHEDNFFIFRGNYYDNFTQLSLGLIYEDYRFDELYKILLNEKYDLINKPGLNESLKSSVYSKAHYFFSLHNLNGRYLNGLILAFFYNYKFINIFAINYSLKIVFIILNFFALQLLFGSLLKTASKILVKIISLVFVFSFWGMYLFEIDALAQLSSFSIFISIIYLIIFCLEKKKLDNNILFCFTCFFISLLFFYPSVLLLILALITFIFLFNIKFFLLFKKKIFISFCFFLILTSPQFLTIIKYGIAETAIFSNTKKDLYNFWAYFGSFILGRENVVTDPLIVKNIKILLNSNNEIWKKFYEIFLINFKEGYLFVPLNIIVSFFGFYYLTLGKIDNNFFIFFIILNFFILFSVFRNIIKNTKLILTSSNYFILRIIFIFYFFVSLVAIFNNHFYGLLKLYFIFSPFIFLICIIDINYLKVKGQLRYFLIILCVTFPLYKYFVNNNGIGRLDSFPSIIHMSQKKNIKWKLDINKMICQSYQINNEQFSKDHYNNKILADGFISLILDFYSINEINYNEKNLKNCIIKFKNGEFIIYNDK